MTQFKNITLNIFLSFILIFIIFFLFKSGILKNYIVGGPLKDFFIDFKLGFITYLECYKLNHNFEVIQKITDESCWPLEYGKLVLLVPYNENLKLFYLNYLPYITILLFVFTVTFLLNPKNKLEYLFVILAILNPTTLLLIESFFIFFILFFLKVFFFFLCVETIYKFDIFFY